MKSKKNNGIIFSVTALAIAAGLYINSQGTQRGAEIIVGKEPLSKLPAANISAIVIADGKTTLTLKRAEEKWMVVYRNGYPADTNRIDNFVTSMKEMKALRELSAGKDQLGQIGLQDGTRVTLQDKSGNPIHTLTLGKELTAPGSEQQQEAMGRGGFPDRRFVMLDGERTAITVVDQTFSNATTDAADWLDKSFFNVSSANSIEVIYSGTESTNSWKITKPSELGDWKLEGELPEGKELAPNPAAASALSSPSFNDLANDAEHAALDQNATQIKIQTTEGFQYALTVADSSQDSDKVMRVQVAANLPEKRTPGENESDEDKQRLDEEWGATQQTLKDKLTEEQKFAQFVYRVSNSTVSDFLKKRSELLQDIEKGAIEPPTGGGATPFPFQIPPPQD